ncbi:GFA family protein [Cellvibrio sp.]|uniref:GFA family protein n=1 Tax=Cellvibrio sp. TaxID=1965322 RepID=UPI0039648327
MENIKGGCLCGSVRYESNAKPIMTRACWCRTCQHLASGNATVNMVFATDAVSITGELSDFESTADSGNKMHRKFCPKCGVHLFSQAEVRPHILIIRAGTLDEPSDVKIDALIWTSSAPKWAYLDPNIPQFEKQPPAPTVK